MTLASPDGGTVGAVVLAGGRARRMGGSDSSSCRTPRARTLLARVLFAVAGADPVVVVGPWREGLPDAVVLVREDPPFTGPAAALAAAMPEVSSPWVLVLAGDQPLVAPGVPALVAALGAPAAVDGAVLVDGEGCTQWLAGCYRSSSLRAAIAGRALANAALRPMLARLEVALVRDEWGASDDVDDPDDARRLLGG